MIVRGIYIKPGKGQASRIYMIPKTLRGLLVGMKPETGSLLSILSKPVDFNPRNLSILLLYIG